MTINILKKNQNTEIFSIQKLELSIEKALHPSEKQNYNKSQIIDSIQSLIGIFQINANNTITTSIIRALTTRVLIENGLNKSAQNYEKYSKQYLNQNPLSRHQIVFLNEYFLKKHYSELDELKTEFENLKKKFNLDFFDMMIEKKLLISPALFKENIDFQNIVLEDNLTSIFNSLKTLAINHQNHISTSINFSKLRPKNSPVNSTNGLSSGPVAFIKSFLTTIDALDQNTLQPGTAIHKIILDINHPDILEFLILVKNLKNISKNSFFSFTIQFSQNFLESLFKQSDFDLINPQNNETANTLSSANLFDLIISTCRENHNLEVICNNQYSQNYSSLSFQLNLEKFISNNNFDFDEIDNLLTLLSHLKNRLGVSPVEINIHGLGSALQKLSISYSSVQTIELAEKIATIFEKFKKQLSFTGKQSILANNIFNSTSTLEPFENLVKFKTHIDGSEKTEIIPELENLLNSKNLINETVLHSIAAANSISFLSELSQSEKKLFQTNNDLFADWQLKIKHIFESKLESIFNKQICFSKSLSHSEVNQLLISHLKRNLQSLSLLQFEETEDNNLENTFSVQKKFLMNLHQKKRKSRQVQQPLFQIKKTEEITLPPINILQ